MSRFLFILFFPRLHAVNERIALLEQQKAKVESERDEYRRLYLDKVEYIALNARQPRFDITQKRESTPQESVNARPSLAETDAKYQAQFGKEYREWLAENPNDLESLSTE